MSTAPEIIGDVVTVEVLFDGETWTDVTGDVVAIDTKRGANRVQQPVLRYTNGNGSITLNNHDRQYDPTNLNGPYVESGETLVLPMRQVRIRGTYNSTTYGIMRAFVDSWNLEWNGPDFSQAVVPFTDGFKVLESYDRIAVDPAVGAGEDSGARIERILDSVDWPDDLRDIATGNSTMQATTLSGSALTECFLVADSELGEFYVNGDGEMVFRNRHAMLQEERSNTVQATFGDSDSELRYANNGLTLNYDHETLANRVQIARTGGTQQVATDDDSVAKYLTRTFNRTDLLHENDAETLAYAQWVLFTSRLPELRFDIIKIDPLRDPENLIPEVLGREIGDRIRVYRRPPGGGDPIIRDVFIRGIQHTITPSKWMTTWVLQSATKYGSFFVLDNPILGLLNSTIGIGY